MNNLKNNQLPEWAKGSPEVDDGDFSIDFGHPDAPKQVKTRTVSDSDIDLNAIQMFDIVHGKNVIGLIDRRAGGRKVVIVKEQTDPPKKSIISSIREKMGSPPKEEEKKEIVAIGEIVLMVKEKVVGSGSLDDISEVILTLIKDSPDISDDDIVLFKRIGLDVILDNVDAKY